jgi:hypothetical protein
MNPHRLTLTALMLTTLYHVAQLALLHYAHVPPAPGKPGAADSGVIWWIARPSAEEWREARRKILQPTDHPLCGPAGLLEMAADHARTNPSAWEICATKEHGYIDGDLPRRKNCDGCDSARARRALTRLRDCGESR